MSDSLEERAFAELVAGLERLCDGFFELTGRCPTKLTVELEWTLFSAGLRTQLGHQNAARYVEAKFFTVHLTHGTVEVRKSPVAPAF